MLTSWKEESLFKEEVELQFIRINLPTKYDVWEWMKNKMFEYSCKGFTYVCIIVCKKLMRTTQ